MVDEYNAMMETIKLSSYDESWWIDYLESMKSMCEQVLRGLTREEILFCDRLDWLLRYRTSVESQTGLKDNPHWQGSRDALGMFCQMIDNDNSIKGWRLVLAAAKEEIAAAEEDLQEIREAQEHRKRMERWVGKDSKVQSES